MAVTFPTVTDALDWPTGERRVRSDVRGLHTSYHRQMAVEVRRRLSLLDVAVAVVVIWAFALLTVVIGHGL